MSEQLLVAILVGLGGMLAWGLSDFVSKRTLNGVDDFRFVFWLQVFGVLPVIALVIAQGHIPTISFLTLGWLALFGISEAVSDILMYRGFSKGPVSLLSPVFASYSGITALLSILVFGEVLTGSTLIGLVMIFIGVILINIDFRDIRSVLKRRHTLLVPGMREILSATLIYATFLVLYDQVISGQDWAVYLMLVRGIEVLALLVYATYKRKAISLEKPEKKLWHFIALAAVLDVIAYGFISYGFSHTSYTSIVAVLSATFSLPTMLLAWRFLKEKVNPRQVVAAFSILAGIVIIFVT